MFEDEGKRGRGRLQRLAPPGDACEDVAAYLHAVLFPALHKAPECAAREEPAVPGSLSAAPYAPGDACEDLPAYAWAHFKQEASKARKRRERLRGRAALARARLELGKDGRLDENGCEIPVQACRGERAHPARLFTCVCRNNCDVVRAGASRGTWLHRVEVLTAGFREARAEHHEARARAVLEAPVVVEVVSHGADGAVEARSLPLTVERVRDGRKVRVPASEAAPVAVKWHRARADGQRRKFETVTHCGEGAVAVRCGGCGSATAATMGCDARRLCVRCRDRGADRRRSRFARARGRLLDTAGRMGLTRRARPGGRYTEKHLTLTLPDGWVVGEGAVGWRTTVLLEAWRGFSQRLQRWAKKSKRRLWFFRGFEWTAGKDGLGHPHLHVWLFCPFLPVKLIRWFWALSLQEQGVLVFGCGPARLEFVGPSGRARRNVCPVDVPVIVDVREVTVRRASIRYEVIKGGRAIQLERERLRVEAPRVGGGVDLVAYVEGWVVSERDTNGDIVPPEVVAELYAVLEGRRQSQASAGFLGLAARECSCPSCGTVGRWRVDVVRWWDGELAEKRAVLGAPLERAGPGGPGVVKGRVDVRDGWKQLRLVG